MDVLVGRGYQKRAHPHVHAIALACTRSLRDIRTGIYRVVRSDVEESGVSL